MTPLESELLQHLGIVSLYNVEQLSIAIFLYGASSLLVVYSPSISSIKGIFVVLFSASVVFFMFVFSFMRIAYFLARPDPLRFHRRRGLFNRATAAMFVVTVINFLLTSFGIGTTVATFILSFRKALTPDVEYPLSEKRELVDKALQNLSIADVWSASLPVSSNLSLLDSVSVHAWSRYYPAI